MAWLGGGARGPANPFQRDPIEVEKELQQCKADMAAYKQRCERECNA
jgi:hypothetical protein